jgi:hypothetical protein
MGEQLRLFWPVGANYARHKGFIGQWYWTHQYRLI